MHPILTTCNSFIISFKQHALDVLYAALKEAIQLNWDIRRMIVEKKEQIGWGKSVVKQISKDLQEEFPGQSGWSTRNLWRMKQFYETYRHNEFLPPMVAKIGWTHNCIIMEKCKDDLKRELKVLGINGIVERNLFFDRTKIK